MLIRNLIQGNTDTSLIIDFHVNGGGAVSEYNKVNYYGVCQSSDSYYNRLKDAVSNQIAKIYDKLFPI